MTKPTEKQIRMMHLVNLMSIAYADGQITEDENNVLIDIAQQLDLTEDEFNTCVEHWKNTDENDLPISIPETEDEQIEYLKHFTLVMMSDGEIEENEKQYLIFVADRYGFNGEEVVPTLIDMVYNEYFANNDQDEEEEEEDPLFEDTYDDSQISLGKMELESKNLEAAFNELFLPSLRNTEAFTYFQIIPGIDTRLFRITPEQLEKVQEAADKGYAVAHYVMGRYHQVVKPEEDSLDKAQQYLESASKAGIPDADWALAMRYLLGYNGLVLIDKFNEMIEQAFEKGSMMALKQRLHDTIHGEHGQKADPKTVIKQIEAFLDQDEDNAAKYPYMYDLLGDAYRKVGNKDKADECYEQAVDHGLFEADAHRFENRIEGPDKDFYRETFSFLLSFARDNKAPECALLDALEEVHHYDTENPVKHEATAQRIKDHLENAFNLGMGDAAYYLGKFNYEGTYGFEKNDREAWMWFSKGQDLESGLAFTGMAKMIEDGIMPSNLPSNYLEYLHLCAVRRGVTAMLPVIVEDYKAGKLDALAEEVEKTYIPALSQMADQSGIPTVIIVNPEGKATIYRLEKAEWNKLPHLIGAKRIAPVCVDAFDKFGKKAGLTDRLVAWIDIDAPRKGLPVNNIASKIYNGVIAGDVVFSFVDKIYEQMPFYGVDEAKAVVKALGAELTDVVTDLRTVSDEKRKPMDYSKVNPKADKGFVVRIEPDGKAHIVNSSLGVFALFEEDIYDPARLQSLYDLGTKLGLKGRLTLWTDNSALRKHMVMESMAPVNPIGAKWYPGLVASNIFVALEDDNYRMTLFDSAEQATQAAIALGIAPENISTDK